MIRKHNNTDVTDFMNILAEEAMELPSGVSLEDTMNSWISQGGYPFITVVRNYEEESAIIYQVYRSKYHCNFCIKFYDYTTLNSLCCK